MRSTSLKDKIDRLHQYKKNDESKLNYNERKETIKIQSSEESKEKEMVFFLVNTPYLNDMYW